MKYIDKNFGLEIGFWEKVLVMGLSAQVPLKLIVYKCVPKYLSRCNEETRYWSKMSNKINYFTKPLCLLNT